MAAPRKLAYIDRFVWLLEQTVSAQWDDCDDFTDRYVFPDMTTQVPLVIYLSQEEWTTLYSAVLTGADLSYPNTSHDVEYLFLQTVICAMNTFCAAMIDCLQNDPDTLAALIEALANAGYTGGLGDPTEPLEAGILAGNLLPAGYICTDDKAFGMAYAVVDAIHAATLEVLQAIEILTNPVEIAAELGDNVPGIGALSTAGDIARWIQDSATEAYVLAWSAVTRDELACLLWCDFKGDCVLSYDTIWDIYLAESGASPPAGVLLTDWLAWLIAIPFTAALSTVATVSLLGLLAMRYGGSFGDFALGIQSLQTVIDLAQDDSSPDWATVCDPCATTWCYVWLNGDITGLVSEASFGGCFPVVTTTEVTGCTAVADTGQRAGCVITFTAPDADITSVTIEVDVHPTRGTFRHYYLSYDDVLLDDADLPEGASTQVITRTITADKIKLFVDAASNLTGTSPDGDGAFSYIRSIKIQGTGSNPMGAGNCP